MTTVKVNLKVCSDIRCFDDSHRFCPLCYGIFHLVVEPKEKIDNVEVKKCVDARKCWNTRKVSHTNCPDCYRSLHVEISS